MREHLYRGIPKSDSDRHFFADIWKDNCEGSFVYGSLIISNDRYYICVSALCKINCCINNGMTSMIEVIPETVGQYTGLTDKNGKKIFEGDILDPPAWYTFYDSRPCVCIFGEEHTVDNIQGFGLYQNVNDRFELVFSDEWDEFKIIGNKHDNPELLKGGEG